MAAGDDFRRFRYEEQGPDSPAEPPEGRLIAIVSPKGGVGKTFLAVNLAVLFSERSRRVALLDLDLAAGDIGLQLDLLQGPTIVDLLPYLEGMEPETLDRFVTHYKCQ